MIDANWDISRVQLSRRVCEGLKWRSRNGRLKEVNCRKVLSRLGRDGKIRLPEAKRFGGNRKPRKEAEVVAAETVKSGDLKDFQPVELVLVGSADSEQSRIWNELMDRYHYLGSGPLCGRSEEHTSELQSLTNLVCRLLLEKKNKARRIEVLRS